MYKTRLRVANEYMKINFHKEIIMPDSLELNPTRVAVSKGSDQVGPLFERRKIFLNTLYWFDFSLNWETIAPPL